MRMRIAVLALAVLALGGKAEAAGPPPLHVLFVGNSLTATNDLPGMVAALGKASRFRDVEVRTIAPGGWSLEDHWRLGEAPESDSELLPKLPDSARSLIEASRELYARVERLDRCSLGDEPQASPVRSLLNRLERSL